MHQCWVTYPGQDFSGRGTKVEGGTLVGGLGGAMPPRTFRIAWLQIIGNYAF